MIVCLCKNVSCSTVRRAVIDGARDVASVARACGAGGDCGACHADLEAIVHEVHEASGARRLPMLDERRPNRAA